MPNEIKARKTSSDTRPLGAPHSWAKTPGTLISGQAAIDGADHAAVMMETKWGADRLRLLVSPELREKFDRQRYLLNRAIWHGDLETVRREAARMAKAWEVLDQSAELLGDPKLDPAVWELALEDGTVVALVRHREDARHVIAEGRQVIVMDLDEISRMISNYREVVDVKITFPGAEVTAIRRTISDPLDRLVDSEADLDDPIPDFGSPLQ